MWKIINNVKEKNNLKLNILSSVVAEGGEE